MDNTYTTSQNNPFVPSDGNSGANELQVFVDDTVAYIHISFWQRSFANKLLWLVYKAFRVFYVSVWFYFLPFVVIMGSYLIPLYMTKKPFIDPFRAAPTLPK